MTRGGATASTTRDGSGSGLPSCPSCPVPPCYDRPVRIGIDARKLHDFGIGTYIRNLLRQLARLDHETEFVLLCRPDDRDGARVARRELPAGRRDGRQLLGRRADRRFRWRSSASGVTLFHAPHYVLPPLVRCRSVVTIHDCIHLMFPQYLPNRLALALRAGVDRRWPRGGRRGC